MVRILSIYLFLAVIGTSLLTVFTMTKAKVKYMRYLSMLSFGVTIYAFGYALELNSEALADIKFWNLVQSAGFLSYPIFWFLMGMDYTGRLYKDEQRKVYLLFVLPLISFVLRCFDSPLIYREFKIIEKQGMHFAYMTRGIWYQIHGTYIFVLLVATLLIFYIEYKKGRQKERKKLAILFVSSFLPFMGLVFNVIHFNDAYIDYAIMTLPISLLLIFFAIMRYDWLEIRSLAREQAFEFNQDGLIIVNQNGMIMDYNEEVQRIFSMEKRALLRLTVMDLLAYGTDEKIDLQQQGSYRLSLDDEGKLKHYEVRVHSIDQIHSAKGYIINFRDNTEREILYHQLQQLANIDSLSGLNNRRSFLVYSEKLIQRSMDEKSPCSMLMLDIDHFKAVNDTYGHHVGDLVIQKISQLLRQNFRRDDGIGRMGGEEFAIILPGTNLKEAVNKAEKFRKILEKASITKEYPLLRITCSIGVAQLSENISTVEGLLHFADKALYRSKDDGRNRTSA
ncbi:MAG: diguanylate cyclase [Vallitaleaceae bacterium]|nr:diguanylate cyclase [Vallitaleaceae bacterium]